MLFNSLNYILFLPLMVFVYYVIPAKYRWILLLAGSYFFYMCWKVEYIFLILLSTLVVFYTSLKISQSDDKRVKKKYLFLSLLINFGILFFFKYYNFTAFNFNWILNQLQLDFDIGYLKILLPVGISFYTFQAVSYTSDVYLGKTKPEKHLGYFALYLSYFPQLIAGPIERAQDLIPQLKSKVELNYTNFRYGINKILLGFFKKVIVADTLAIYVDYVYHNFESVNGLQLYIGIIFFGVQMFCDFSGYCDIAVGSARMMGVKLSENFNRPYLALSIAQYWQRWHITLTNWIRDYLFIPLMYKRPKNFMMNTLLVFIAIGIWHGASLNYIVFGVIHGVISLLQYWYGMSKWTPKLTSKAGIVLRWLFNYHLVMFSAIFFRAQSFDQAITIMKRIFLEFTTNLQAIFVGISPFEFFVNLFLIALLGVTATFNKDLRFKKNFAYIGVMLILILIFGQNKEVQFIYFQF